MIAELFNAAEIPFNLAGELIDNSTTSEGEARVRALAESEARRAQTQLFDDKYGDFPICKNVEEIRATLTLSKTFRILTGNQSSATPAEYSGPFPRKRHSHRCPNCTSAVACYKAQCRKPQRIARQSCPYCRL